MKAKIVSRAGARCDSDSTIGYDEDGTPIAIAEEDDGGYYIEVAEGERVVNDYEGRQWYVEDGEWHSVHNSCTVSVDDMPTRNCNDGTQTPYDGELEAIA